MVKSTIKRYRFSSREDEIRAILKDADEAPGLYCTVFGRPVERRPKWLQNVPLEAVPLDVRRKKAKKPLYLMRYK